MNEFLKCCMEVVGYHEPIKPFRRTKNRLPKYLAVGLHSYLEKIDLILEKTPVLGMSIDINGTDSPKIRRAMLRYPSAALLDGSITTGSPLLEEVITLSSSAIIPNKSMDK